MNDSRLNPFKGKLSAAQIAKGITLCKKNAARLRNDAQLLFEKECFATSCSIAILGIEELGKLAVLRRMAIAESHEQWRACWKDFSDHLAKNTHWIVPFLVAQRNSFEQFVESFFDGPERETLNSLKQLGFYVGCYGNAHWADPLDVIGKEQANIAIHSLSVLLVGSQQSRFDSPESVKAWSDQMRGFFSGTALEVNYQIVSFLKSERIEGLTLTESGIPIEVAFEFMSTVLYLSKDRPISPFDTPIIPSSRPS